MRILNTVHIRGVGHLGVVCLLTFLLLPRLSFGQVEQDETVGVPPGKDIGGDRGVGVPPTSKLKQAVQRDGKFHLLEATIDDIHSALQKRPPYTPDLNPEEECHRHVKPHLRKAQPSGVSDLRAGVDQ